MQARFSVYNHQRLDAYRLAVEFAAWLRRVRQPSAPLKLQLERASESIVLNIAEAASQQSLAMAKKHYRVALGSAAECAAGLDLLAIRGVPTEPGRDLINRVGMMLRRLAR